MNQTEESKADTTENNEDEYEKVCYICRRPESKAGKMISMPGNIYICPDCMQKTFDSINNSGMSYEDMLKMSGMNMNNIPNMPNMGMFMNDMDMSNMNIPNKQKVKKKKTDEQKKEEAIDLSKVPAPHQIKGMLDEYVIGQEYAKKVMSVAVYNHYKRVATNTMDEIEIEKSNMLMIGPTGSGKTYLVKTLARLLQVPLAIADATSLTEAGYIGDDIESVVSKLLAAADNDVEKAEHGIIFIDEIDKIAKKKETRSRDVSGESVQQGMLKLLEGADIEVPVGATSKNAMVPQVTVNTRNILFICGGAFPDLENIIKERLNKQSSMGFNADLKDKYDNQEVLEQVTIEDLREFGMIPEFLGRLPIIFTLNELTKDMLVRIMKEPRNAILKQYEKLLELDEVKLKFNDEALEAIAEKAIEKKTGARALRSIIEKLMLDIMYEIPKDDNIGCVTITGEYVKEKGAPLITMRGADLPLLENQA
ncbi:MAG: ATP-dependent Clp protease ATP-binding subunit ClpX [Lachnospira sp.]|nr:ATP-dependent Clp protease ATP-binding subunit ClpX [Lachnospira sp.]